MKNKLNRHIESFSIFLTGISKFTTVVFAAAGEGFISLRVETNPFPTSYLMFFFILRTPYHYKIL